MCRNNERFTIFIPKGKQLKELKAIAQEEPNPEKAKTKVFDKIKSWGGDVLANVVANIVTNPAQS